MNDLLKAANKKARKINKVKGPSLKVPVLVLLGLLTFLGISFLHQKGIL